MALVFLDHIVILLRHKDVVHPPKRLTDHFTVTPGGTHAGGQTENKLIVFQDGSYIELIAFVDDDPKHRANHRWGDREVGIIDFALSSTEDAEDHFERLKERLDSSGSGLKYEPPTPGGRTRDDGQVLKWKITSPDLPLQRGEAPFFCHDVTSRELRVPFSKESTSHPSAAYGIAGLNIYVLKENVSNLSTAYSSILEVNNSSKNEKIGTFEIGSLHIVGGNKALMSIQEPPDERRRKLVEESGVLLKDLKIGIIGEAGSIDWETVTGDIDS